MRCIVVSADVSPKIFPEGLEVPIYTLKPAKPRTILPLDYDLKEALDELFVVPCGYRYSRAEEMVRRP